STADGTAVSTQDYTSATNQTLTFPNSTTSYTFNVATTDDAVPEPQETFGVTLSSPMNGVSITTASATGYINDNDTQPFTWTGATGDHKWSTAGNWSTGVKPGASDTAIFNSACAGANCNVDIDQLVNVNGVDMQST